MEGLGEHERDRYPSGISLEEWRAALAIFAARTFGHHAEGRFREVPTPLNRSVIVADNPTAHLLLVVLSPAGVGGLSGVFGEGPRGLGSIGIPTPTPAGSALVIQLLYPGEELWYKSNAALATHAIVVEVMP